MTPAEVLACRGLGESAVQIARVEQQLRHARDTEPMPWRHRTEIAACVESLRGVRGTILNVLFERAGESAEVGEIHRLTQTGINAIRGPSEAKRDHAEWKRRQEGADNGRQMDAGKGDAAESAHRGEPARADRD